MINGRNNLANILTYLSAKREVETDKRPINYHNHFREIYASQLVTKPLNSTANQNLHNRFKMLRHSVLQKRLFSP